jgi:hypothetical protein
VLWTCCSKGINKSKNTHGAYYTRMKWYYKKNLQKLIHDKELKMNGMNWTPNIFLIKLPQKHQAPYFIKGNDW